MRSSEEAPPEVVELAARRQLARESRDFAEADRLRGMVAGAGWVVTDSPGGFQLSRLGMTTEIFADPGSVPSLLGQPPATVHSLCVPYYGWPEDVGLLLGGLLAATDAVTGSLEVVVALAGAAAPPPDGILPTAHPALYRAPLLVRVSSGFGHAEAFNAAARRAHGEFVHFVEPSLRLTWNVLAAAAGALADPGVGATGPFGLATEDWRDFHPASGTDVMALEYLVSVRRADIAVIGEMDPGFRFYRNLDIDYSRQVVAAGFALRRYEVEVERGPHRLWEATPVEERDRLSRRNFNRLLDRWVRPRVPGS
ncbi:MAG: cysteinyl-tRNA synthetase [Chloroflexota bacterium]|jgi:cysteinyl-tRNA synthetase|nr:cysteinyl-tRNA synthetase [Chloroflexota bacterium]